MIQASKIRKLLRADRKAAVCALLLSIALSGVHAQEQAPAQSEPKADDATEEVQSVQITSVKDPAMMPYKRAYEFLSGVEKEGNGRVQLLIKIASEKTGKPFPDLSVSLQGEKTFEKLAVSPTGFITVPLSKEAYDDGAEIMTNKKKGSLDLRMFLVPKFTTENLSYRDITASIESVRHAIAEIFPWYLRLLIPSVKGIGICYPDNKQTVAISNSAETARAATNEETSETTDAKIFCANFSAKEPGLTQDSVITPASGWNPIFF